MVALQYLDTDQSNTLILPYDIKWGDYVLQEGSSATLGITTEVLRVFFGRKFSEGENYEFGAGAGFHWLELGAYAEGQFFLNDERLDIERQSVSAKAPLPNIGVWYIYAVSDRWAISSRLDYLSASVGDYSGGLTNAQLGLGYQAWKNLSLGLSYNYLSLNVDVDSGDWQGAAEATRHGPYVYLTINW